MRMNKLCAWLLSRFPQPAYVQIITYSTIGKCRQSAVGK